MNPRDIDSLLLESLSLDLTEPVRSLLVDYLSGARGLDVYARSTAMCFELLGRSGVYETPSFCVAGIISSAAVSKQPQKHLLARLSRHLEAAPAV